MIPLHLKMTTRTITTLKRRKTKEQVRNNSQPDRTQFMVMTAIMQREKKLIWKQKMKTPTKMKMRRKTPLILMKASNNLILW